VDKKTQSLYMEDANETQLDILFISFYLLILYIDVNCNCIVYRIYSSWILQYIMKQRVCYCTVRL
jgi:hypothetical protein